MLHGFHDKIKYFGWEDIHALGICLSQRPMRLLQLSVYKVGLYTYHCIIASKRRLGHILLFFSPLTKASTLT